MSPDQSPLRLVERMARREAAALLLSADEPLALRVEALACPVCGVHGADLSDRLNELRFRDTPLHVSDGRDGTEAVGLTVLACERPAGRSALLAAVAVRRAGCPPRHGFRTRAATWAQWCASGPDLPTTELLVAMDREEAWVDQLLADPATVTEQYGAVGGAVLPWAPRSATPAASAPANPVAAAPVPAGRASYAEQWEDRRRDLATRIVTPHPAGEVMDELDRSYLALRLAAVGESL